MPSSRCAAGWTRSTPRVASRSASSCTSAARRWAPTATTPPSPLRRSARRASRPPRARCSSARSPPWSTAFACRPRNSLEAGFDGIELHAAHAYLLEQFLSPRTNRRGDGMAVLERVIEAIRRLSDSALLGIRLSIDASEDVALEHDELADLLRVVDPLVDWVNVTVGVRTTYVRDMATTRPPLLDELARLRPMVRGPLLVSHAFRHPGWIEEALAGGADLVGMARPLIADPDLPRKLFDGPARRDPAVRRLQRGLPHVRPAAAVHRQPRPGASGGAAAARRAARARAATSSAWPAAASPWSAPVRPAWSARSALAREGVRAGRRLRGRRPHRRSAGDRGRRAEPLRLGAAAGLL